MRPNPRSNYRPRGDIIAYRNTPEEFRLVGAVDDIESNTMQSAVKDKLPAAQKNGDFKKLLNINMANVGTMLAYTRTAFSLTGGALGMLRLGDPSRPASYMLVAVALLGCYNAINGVVVYEMTRQDLSMAAWPMQHARFLRVSWVAGFTALVVVAACTTIVYDHYS